LATHLETRISTRGYAMKKLASIVLNFTVQNKEIIKNKKRGDPTDKSTFK
jgi:hypothetical protein